MFRAVVREGRETSKGVDSLVIPILEVFVNVGNETLRLLARVVRTAAITLRTTHFLARPVKERFKDSHHSLPLRMFLRLSYD